MITQTSFCVGDNNASSPRLTHLFPLSDNPDSGFAWSIVASPLAHSLGNQSRVIVPVSDGTIAVLHAKTGAMLSSVQLPTEAGHQAYLVATPVRIEHKLVVAYQTVYQHVRTQHRVAVVDLKTGALDPNFPVLVLSAKHRGSDGTDEVIFEPSKALSRAALVHARTDDRKLGYAYVSYGNSRDIQPWHGWLFEIDLDAWKNYGVSRAVSAVLLTTPEAECAPEGTSGATTMICGGGIWSPAGPQVYYTSNGFELLVPTGNGQLDLRRHDYANTLMRVGRGLEFNPGCDAALCASFEQTAPRRECIESCKDLFIPRLMPADPPFRPASGICDTKTFQECLAILDYDLGANSPVKLNLRNGISVYVMPAKDGGVYLIDANHMGKLYDRIQAAPICGTLTDKCLQPWAGMITTQPVITEHEGEPLVIIPTYVSDNTQPAGLVALKIAIDNDQPAFQTVWRSPSPGSEEARRRFRFQPSRAALWLHEEYSTEYVWIIDVRYGAPGEILGIRVRDGTIIVRQPMRGTAQRYNLPLIHDNVMYVPAVSIQSGRSWIEAYQIH